MSANITAVTNQSSTTDGATALAGIKTALTNIVTDVDLKAPLISPSLTTPTLGVATATSINKVAITAPATGSTLTIDDGFTLHATGNVTALSGSHTGTSSGTNTGDQTISDATITTTDITTNNVSTSKHGFAPKAPNDATKFLDGTGAYSVPATGNTYSVGADESVGTYFTKQIPMIPTSTTAITGWTLTSTTITNNGAGSYITLTPTSSTNFEMSTGIFGTGSSNDYSIADNKTIRIKFRLRVDDSSDRKGWGICITPANIHTAHTDVTNGEVRFIYNTTTLYAQNANGSTATSTDVTSGITVTNWNIYEIVFLPGTSAKFYINGTLVATHTTNLPTSGTPVIAYGVNANGRVVRTLEPIISIER